MTGIEPALSAWEADVLPLNYIRNSLYDDLIIYTFTGNKSRHDRNLSLKYPGIFEVSV